MAAADGIPPFAVGLVGIDNLALGQHVVGHVYHLVGRLDCA